MAASERASDRGEERLILVLDLLGPTLRPRDGRPLSTGTLGAEWRWSSALPEDPIGSWTARPTGRQGGQVDPRTPPNRYIGASSK